MKNIIRNAKRMHMHVEIKRRECHSDPTPKPRNPETQKPAAAYVQGTHV